MAVVTDDRVMRRALLDALPLIVPAVPFGLVLGLAITESGIGNLVGWSSAPIVYAGAAQLTLVTLLGGGAAWVAAVAAALVVNLRHAMYSAALAPAFQHQPRWFRWLAPYGLIDQMFVLAMLRKDEEPGWFRRYYLVAGTAFGIFWSAAVALGLLIGPVVPEQWHLEFAIPVMFAGVLVIGLDERPKVVAAVVAASVALAGAGLPSKSGLLAGALAGVLAGIAVDRRRP